MMCKGLKTKIYGLSFSLFLILCSSCFAMLPKFQTPGGLLALDLQQFCKDKAGDISSVESCLCAARDEIETDIRSVMHVNDLDLMEKLVTIELRKIFDQAAKKAELSDSDRAFLYKEAQRGGHENLIKVLLSRRRPA